MNQLTDIDTDMPTTTNKTSPLAPASLSGSRAHGSYKIEDDSPSPGQANRKPTENTLLLRPQDTPLPCLSIQDGPCCSANVFQGREVPPLPLSSGPYTPLAPPMAEQWQRLPASQT
ncbi:hypothetical protein MHUMG1_04108 [Metarhizium humberi]|uniref:Uncharacterized protein n=1 Tax=Metarhizium humberi TaxID=2596975 RepID=A0A9P8S8A4_9HYPO|nr:hypothetical protein MHUMG1_04108 [Metarhizium humberi]